MQSVSASGINQIHIIVTIIAVLCLSSCTIIGGGKISDHDASKSYRLEEEKRADKKEGDQSETLVNFPHPMTTRYEDLQILLIKNRPPEVEHLNMCRKEIESLADEVLNVDDILIQRKKISYEVGTKAEFYHWCFYYALFALENNLRDDSLAVDLSEKSANFHRTFKGLWLLADSLQYNTRSALYLKKLQIKYIQLSNDYFARNLEPTLVFDPEEIKVEAPPAPLQKAAGEAQTE